jgi:competence protein ComEA
MTYDKARVGKYFGKLTASEMRAVEDGLEEVFDLGYADTEALTAKDKEIEELKVKIAELTGEVAREQAKSIELQAKHEDELLSYKVENTMWQKCYDKVLSQLVDMKCMNDLVIRGHLSAEPKLPEVADQPRKPVKVIDPEEPVLPVVNIPEKVVVTETRVDINHCTQTQLKKVGMSDALARAVVAKRPFNSVADLKNVQGMTKKKFQIWESKLCCTPLEIIEIPAEPVVPEEPVTEVVETVEAEGTEGKLNINAASGKEINEKTGLHITTSYAIVGYRRKNGPYEKLEDLLKVTNVYPGTLEKFRDTVWFGPGIEETPITNTPRKKKEPTEPYTGERVNINTAKAEEIHEKIGLNKSVCYYITGYRKKNGPYKSINELLNVPRFTEYHLINYGPMFEV